MGKDWRLRSITYSDAQPDYVGNSTSNVDAAALLVLVVLIHPDRHGDCNGDGNSYGDSYGYSNRHGYGDSYGYSNRHGNTDTVRTRGCDALRGVGVNQRLATGGVG